MVSENYFYSVGCRFVSVLRVKNGPNLNLKGSFYDVQYWYSFYYCLVTFFIVRTANYFFLFIRKCNFLEDYIQTLRNRPFISFLPSKKQRISSIYHKIIKDKESLSTESQKKNQGIMQGFF